jgi:hypothetical protein
LNDQKYQGIFYAFGFGYNLDSKLLSEIAVAGSGSYSFIPDCTMVGTVFVNFLANSLSALAKNSSIKLEALNGSQIVGG